MTTAEIEQKFNLNLLSDRGKEELFDFYEFLVFKYPNNDATQDNKTPQQSKWANIVRRIERDPVHLAGYGEQLKQEMREFRESFVFTHEASS